MQLSGLIHQAQKGPLAVGAYMGHGHEKKRGLKTAVVVVSTFAAYICTAANSSIKTTVFTGVHSNQDLRWCVKIGVYMGFWAHRGF